MPDVIDWFEIRSIIQQLSDVVANANELSEDGGTADLFYPNEDLVRRLRQLSALLSLRLHIPLAKEQISASQAILSVVNEMRTTTGEQQAELVNRLQGTVSRSPDALIGHMTLARLAFRNGHFEDAISALRRAEEVGGRREHYLLASLMWRAGRVDEALAEADQGIKAEPSRVDSYSLLAQILRHTGRTEEAVAALERGIAATAGAWDRASLYVLLGECKLDQRDPSGALSAWERAIEQSRDPLERAALERRISSVRARPANSPSGTG